MHSGSAAKQHPGFVSVQLCIPVNNMNERVIIGTWATRADWEAWHSTEEFQQTRARLEEPDAKSRRESWFEVMLTELRPDQAAYIGVPKEGPFKSDHYRY